MRITELTQDEEQAYLALVADNKNKVRPEAEEIRKSRIQAEAPKLAQQQNITMAQAAEAIRSRASGKLLPDDVIQFQAIGNISVANILADPAKYDNQPCADPLEPEEGTSKAKFYANADGGTPLIHSMLHGSTNYLLQQDMGGAPQDYAAETRKTKQEVIRELTEYRAQGEIQPDQWCGVLAGANLSHTDTDSVLDFLSATLQVKKASVKREYQEFLGRMDAKNGYDKLREAAKGKVIVNFIEHDLNKATELTEKAILDVPGEWPYFSYGSVLSYATYDIPAKQSNGVDDEKPPMVPVIKPYTRDSLHLRIEQSTLHYKVPSGKNGMPGAPVAIATPQPIVSKLIEHPSPQAPRVTGLVSHPVLDLDGRLINTEGIDEKTGLLLQFGGSSFYPLPRNVTHGVASRAAWTLRYSLFGEFCFRSNHSQKDLYAIAALAMLMTGIFRKVIDQAPAFLVVANVQGSGKTTLARIVHVILTGRDMPVSSLGSSAEEMKKEMLATFLQSPAMVCYDNILDGSEINDAILAKAITSPEFKGRILGKSQEATVPTNTVIALTGNNVTLCADLVRRFITVSLTADTAQPESRVFKHPDIVQYSLNKRRQAIQSCLAITKGYIDAGCPINAHEHASSGFVQWDRMVRFPLLWATGVDVLKSMNENRQQSTEIVAMSRVMNCLAEIFGDGTFTASKIMAAVEQSQGSHDEVVDTISESLSSMTAKALTSIKSLAWVLKKLEGRIIDGMVLHREQHRNRADEYRVTKKQDARRET